MGTQISNNHSTWERITTGLGNSFSTLWDRRDDIGNDISTAYDGGVQGTQDIAGKCFLVVYFRAFLVSISAIILCSTRL